MEKIKHLLKKASFFPIMGQKLTPENTIYFDFSESNNDLEKLNLADMASFSQYVPEILDKNGKKFGYGGYLEHRSFYKRSPVFATPSGEYRNIHLGVDIWANIGHPVFVPMDGEIHSFFDHDELGNYGPVIILKHQIEGIYFHSLFGHLSKKDLTGLEKGKKAKAGEIIGHIGAYEENGNWPPHLHFQLVIDMEGQEGDYLGVCAESDLEKYKNNCPDPSWLIFPKN
ncbi:peptidoglycan DD-metalloendopeptidase family protein [Echinicola jeungdonensis]|uniref:Peptidoglycan DD-metalloendopeptidase family protein n=1 Tax=Echinicola jeungdonensis TaxID=709343 RepID=A0ABV5J9C5_9BACT|nr:peptidoglycan DD-metalloendopeptidase family protein [Echinicola jeungdonensis]MDN3669117.1 peptidoglycan DD-metalloendopeptidase family protein [Echinicola jeungdonensis]